ncbi:galanin receptor 2b-like [Dysidea avara]|uniref:galanin receptor 2b-like n=1 Tax=Dysidea avara TaxID=196820 RepID=UPI003316AAB4
MDDLAEMSTSGSGAGQETTSTDGPDYVLPRYFDYLSLIFQFIMTMMILPMAGWVFVTIKTTRNLHKPHNIFVANLMVVDIVLAIVRTSVTVHWVIGLDLLSCNVVHFLLFPIVVIHFTYLMISVDKVISIAFPYKHRNIMTPHVVASMITTAWLLGLLLSVKGLLDDHQLCVNGNKLEISLFRLLPMFLSSTVAISLNAYLTIKAYKIRKQIQQESKLSGVNSQVAVLKKTHTKIKKDLKPAITLAVVLFGSSSITLVYVLLLHLLGLLWNPQIIAEVDVTVSPNIIFIVFLLHPVVYGLYFKQVREPMMKTLKGLNCKNKFNTAVVAPMP